MTFWALIRLLKRYWPVVLAGAVCTAGVGLLTLRDHGVYFSRTNLSFRAPASVINPNAFQTQSEEVIITAGVITKLITGPDKVTKFASPDVTLAGTGVRDGWSLRLPDTGGQWATNFSTQMLVLDVVGPSPEAVQARQQEVIGRVQETLSRLQQDADVAPALFITAVPAPESAAVYHITGSRPRALGLTAVLGIGLTIAAVLALDRRRRRHELTPVMTFDTPLVRA